MKLQVSECVLDSAIVLSLSLFFSHDFQGFYHSFIYVNVFSSCRRRPSHLEMSLMLNHLRIVFSRRKGFVFRPVY